MSLIELKDLTKSYGPVQALNRLNLTVPKGSLYGLLGPNGSGKTTTLRIISTLLAPDSGKAIVSGLDVLARSKDVRRVIGYVAQEVAIDKILTGRELLELHGDLYHLPFTQRNMRIEELIERLDMAHWIDRRSGSYSGGMKRRLDLATGLLHKPDLLILDEPTVGLDIESRSVVWGLLKELHSQGVTILLSSHYLEEVDSLADQIAIIDHGKVIAEGSPGKLKEKLGRARITLKVNEFSNPDEAERVKNYVLSVEGVKKVIINSSQGFSLNLFVETSEIISTLRKTLKEEGFDIFALSESRPSLDDVYLETTGKTIMDAELAISGTRNLKNEAKESMR